MEIFKEFHRRVKFEKSFNATFVSLTPKKAWVVEIKNFHPISLLGGVNKITSKVIANMLKSELRKIVSNSQYMLIINREIMDSVLMTNE
jgi:hypothetical protein